MTTPPDDVAAMFDLPPLPASSQSVESTTASVEAAEAALAAELESTIEAGGVAADAPDSRTNLRVKVSWPARMQLPDGRVIELKVRDISENGVGLMSDEDIPAYTVVDFEMGVPQPDEDDKITPVKGTIKTSYTVVHGAKILCGGTWQAPPAGLELVTRWIERLRV
jgi:hypothetical protein